MSSTQTVTSFVVNSIRSNDDGTKTLVATVTFSDASTDVVEIVLDRLVP